MSKSSVIFFLVFCSLFIGQASANIGTIIVPTIDIDGITSNAGSSYSATTIDAGDIATTNNAVYALIRFNSTPNYSEIQAIKNNITAVRVWVKGTSASGTPTNPMRYWIDYYYNDTWGAGLVGLPISVKNTSTYKTWDVPTNGQWEFFEITDSYLNDSDNFTSVVISPSAVIANAVHDRYRWVSSEGASGSRPYMEIMYDNSTYSDTFYNTQLTINLTDNSGYNRASPWIGGAVETDLGNTFMFVSTEYQTKTWVFNTTTPVYLNNLTSTGANIINNNYQDLTYSYQAGGSNDCNAWYNTENSFWMCDSKKDISVYFVNTSNIIMKVSGRSFSPPIMYNNYSPVLIGQNSLMKGNENLYNVTGGSVVWNGSASETITKTLVFNSELLSYNSMTAGLVWNNATQEFWGVFDSDQVSGALWNWQVGNDNLHTGGIFLKGSNVFKSLNGTQAVTYNRVNKTEWKTSLTMKLLPYNISVYANGTDGGYLILNLSLRGRHATETRNQLYNMTGTYHYADGSTIQITNGSLFSETKLLRNWDIPENVTNGTLIDSYIKRGSLGAVYTSDIQSFVVKGNGAGNIQVSIWNSSKNYSAQGVIVINDISGSYNNVTIVGTGTYTITNETKQNSNPFISVGVAAMGIAVSIAIYNMYRRRGRPPMMFIPGFL